MSICQLYSFNKDELNIQKHDERYFVDNFDASKLDKKYVYWLNFHSISKKELLEEFWDKQGYHKLTFEDIYTEYQRPKLEEFENYLFFSIQSALPSSDKSSDLIKEKLSFILGENYLLSFQEKSSDHFPDIRHRLNDQIGPIRNREADFLLFKMLDAIVDNYFEVLDEITDLIRGLEILVLRNSDHETLNIIEVQKRKLIELRRIVMPLKEIAVQLEKIQSPFIRKDNRHYFADLKDNCLSILDDVDSNKQVLEGLTNIYYASQGQRMNEIMKLLTVVSTIFIPLTFIVGLYGMNFPNMPEYKMTHGYLMVWIIMIIIAAILLWLFIRKGWLKNK